MHACIMHACMPVLVCSTSALQAPQVSVHVVFDSHVQVPDDRQQAGCAARATFMPCQPMTEHSRQQQQAGPHAAKAVNICLKPAEQGKQVNICYQAINSCGSADYTMVPHRQVNSPVVISLRFHSP